MKKLSYLTIIFLFAASILSSCSAPLYLKNKFITKDDGVEIYVEEIKKHAQQSGWGNTMLVPPVGHVFYSFKIKLKNSTNIQKEIQFVDFVLIEPSKRMKYLPSKVYKATAVVIPSGENLTLKPGEEYKRIILFAFPKTAKPSALEFKNEVYLLEYQ